MKYSTESAGQHMVHKILVAHPHDTVKNVLERMQQGTYDSLEAIYLVASDRKLIGLIALVDLLPSAADKRLVNLPTRIAPFVFSAVDQEQVASLALKERVTAVPVVDAELRLLGVVPAEALLDILRHEHIEDMQRMAGILKSARQAQHALQDKPVHRLTERLPWLIVGLAGSLLAAWIMTRYQQQLAAHVAVAFFIPAIVYLADAIGTQTENAVVRYLSFNHPSIGRLMWGELITGCLIGIALAVCMFPAILFFYSDFQLALAVSITLVAAGTFAATLALLLPWSLAKLGKDPAFASGPAVTILQDVLSLLIYFFAVSLLVF